MPKFKFEFNASYRGEIVVVAETEETAAERLRSMDEHELSPYIQRYDFEAVAL